MAKYHWDEDIRIDGERHAGVVLHNDKLLLVRRIKDGYEYYVFPGGHRREGEQGTQTAIREVKEEAGIAVSNAKLAFEFRNYYKNNTDYYYICDWVSGEKPQLTGEELDADPAVDLFDPMWVSTSDIDDLNILPKFAKHWLQDTLKQLILSQN